MPIQILNATQAFLPASAARELRIRDQLLPFDFSVRLPIVVGGSRGTLQCPQSGRSALSLVQPRGAWVLWSVRIDGGAPGAAGLLAAAIGAERSTRYGVWRISRDWGGRRAGDGNRRRLLAVGLSLNASSKR